MDGVKVIIHAMLPALAPFEWLLGGVVAFGVGCAKTGVPGIGTLVVPLIAQIFDARLSTGALLPMLSIADIFAVVWYRKHARLDLVWKLIPSVAVGLVIGAIAMDYMGQPGAPKQLVNQVIGGLVLLMLGLQLLSKRLGEKFTPSGWWGSQICGLLAGATTFVSNAAGPIMSIYLTSTGVDKREFMGTSALYFFVINLLKLPVYIFLTIRHPERPMISMSTVAFDFVLIPMIVAGAYFGKKVFDYIPEKLFGNLVLGLSALAAIKLVVG